MKPNWNWTIRVDTLYSNLICYDLWKHTQTHTYASDKFFYQISTDTPFSNVYKMYWMSEYTDGGRQKLFACKIYGIFFTAIGMTISLRSVFWMESVLRNVCIVYIHIHSTYIAHIYAESMYGIHNALIVSFCFLIHADQLNRLCAKNDFSSSAHTQTHKHKHIQKALRVTIPSYVAVASVPKNRRIS